MMMILIPIICLTKGFYEKYMAARNLMTKAKQYRPSKYKQVSPSQVQSPDITGMKDFIGDVSKAYFSALATIFTSENNPPPDSQQSQEFKSISC